MAGQSDSVEVAWPFLFRQSSEAGYHRFNVTIDTLVGSRNIHYVKQLTWGPHQSGPIFCRSELKAADCGIRALR